MTGVAAMLLATCADSAKPPPTPDPASFALVTLIGDTAVLADGRVVKLDDLPKALRDLNAAPGTRIMVRAERDVVYGDAMRIMDVMQGSGFKVALVAEMKAD